MIDRLSAAGYKITGPRRHILETLRSAREPWTAQEIAARASTSVASTYRALALLVELGLVSEVADVSDTPGGPEGRSHRYALCSAAGHHHHFVCRSCHATLEIACDAIKGALAEIERSTGLRVESHDVTLRGLCSRCVREVTA